MAAKMIEIDGFLWFVAALLLCGGHMLYLRGWRREQRQRLAWWQRHDAEAQRRHDACMQAMRAIDHGNGRWTVDARATEKMEN